MLIILFSIYENYDYFSDVFYDPSVSVKFHYLYFFSKSNVFSDALLIVFLICITFWGFLGIAIMRTNYLLIMIHIEIMLLGFGMLFSFMALFRGSVEGYLLTIVIQSIAACEAALGLSLLVSLNTKGISSQFEMKQRAFYDFVSNSIWSLSTFKNKKIDVLFCNFSLLFLIPLSTNNKILFFWPTFYMLVVIVIFLILRTFMQSVFFYSFRENKIFTFFDLAYFSEWVLNLLSFIIFIFNYFMFFKIKTLLLLTGGRAILYNLDFLKFSMIFVFDSYSVYFFILTAFIVWVCTLLVPFLVKDKEKNLFVYFFLYFSQAILMVGFLTENLLLFWVSFEAIVIPLIYFVNTWGSRARKLVATYYLLLYTVLGGILFLLGLLYLYNLTGTFSLSVLSLYKLSFSDQKILWWLFFFTFAVKIPIVPFHLWLPEAHVEASTIGSMILAGLVLKLGGYGFLRYSTILFPEAHAYFSDIVIYGSLFSALFAGLFALRQFDLKKLIAYASVSHMSLGACALFVYNSYSVVGSLMMLIAHAFTAAALFMAIGFLYLRTGTKHGSYYGGLRYNMPKFTFFLFVCFLANISFPGTINFIAEFLMLLGFFESKSTNFLFIFVLFIVLFLNAAFMLLFYNKVSGSISNSADKVFFDLTPLEVITFALFTLPIFYWGIFPNDFLEVFNNDVRMHRLLTEHKRLYW